MNANLVLFYIFFWGLPAAGIIVALIYIRNANEDLKLGFIEKAKFQTVMAFLLVISALVMALLSLYFRI